MAHAYLIEPVEQHKDIKVAVKLFWCKEGKAMIYSPLTDKSFEVPARLIGIKANTPCDGLEHSEYIVDVPEKKVKLGQEAAFAIPGNDYMTEGGNKYHPKQKGISKRLYIATAAMQGILANSTTDASIAWVIAEAYHFADEMLKQE